MAPCRSRIGHFTYVSDLIELELLGAADIPGWYFPYVVCFPIFHVVIRLLSEDTVLFQGTRIVSLHRWKISPL